MYSGVMISLLKTGGQEPQGIMKMLAELASLSVARLSEFGFCCCGEATDSLPNSKGGHERGQYAQMISIFLQRPR